MKLTIIIPVRNEAQNILSCLESVAWADQIFVVDSQSTDDTCAIAKRQGAEVVQFHYDGAWPKKRNWALQSLSIRNDWVLLLDADERVTPELKADIAKAIRQSKYNGFYIKWKFYFLGRWMRYSWSHGWMLRLIRHGYGAYEDLGMRHEGGWDAEVHENVRVKGPTAKLQGLLEHNSNQDLSHWIQKQEEFSVWNARRRLLQRQEPMPPLSFLFSKDPGKHRKWWKAFFLRLPAKSSLLFLYLYVLKLGFLDGREGYYFCKLRAMHELNINAKMFELRRREKNKKG